MNMVKRPLKAIGGFAIEMSENTVSETYCEGCPHQYKRVDEVPAATPSPGLVLAPGPYYWRTKVAENHVYRFRVSSMSPGGGIHPQAVAETVVWVMPDPGPLPGFSAVMGDKSVELGWKRPEKGYRAEIEKGVPGGGWALVTGLDPASGRFNDLAVEYEKTYVYRGRLARLRGDSSRPGPWSREITVKVIDVVPPNPPGYLDAALAQGGVKLSWESLAFDPELAGYRVYRQLSGESGFTRVSPALLKVNTFFDPIAFQAGVTARYQVTAVDKSPRANESRPSPGSDVYLDPPVEPMPRPE